MSGRTELMISQRDGYHHEVHLLNMFSKANVRNIATCPVEKWFENAPETFLTWELSANANKTGPKRFIYPPFLLG
jgi:hypothetical protein